VKPSDLQDIISAGEDTRHQFKREFVNVDTYVCNFLLPEDLADNVAWKHSTHWSIELRGR